MKPIQDQELQRLAHGVVLGRTADGGPVERAVAALEADDRRWLRRRSRAAWCRRTALAAMAMTIGMVATHAIDAARTPEAGIVVFNDHSYTPIVAFDHGKALLWAPDIDSQPAELTRHFSQRHRAFLAHYGINHITATTCSDATCPPRMAVRPPLAWMCGKRIAAADRKSDIGMIFACNAKADIIVIGKHFNADALPAADSAVLVLSGARQKAMPVARGNVHDLASDGALVMLMDE